MRVDYVIFAF